MIDVAEVLDVLESSDRPLATRLMRLLETGAVTYPEDDLGSATASSLLSTYLVRAKHVEQAGVSNEGFAEVANGLRALQADEPVELFGFQGDRDYFLVFMQPRLMTVVGLLWFVPRSALEES